jgi:hypothetical protein
MQARQIVHLNVTHRFEDISTDILVILFQRIQQVLDVPPSRNGVGGTGGFDNRDSRSRLYFLISSSQI